MGHVGRWMDISWGIGVVRGRRRGSSTGTWRSEQGAARRDGAENAGRVRRSVTRRQGDAQRVFFYCAAPLDESWKGLFSGSEANLDQPCKTAANRCELAGARGRNYLRIVGYRSGLQ